jgi:hypothetical protein
MGLSRTGRFELQRNDVSRTYRFDLRQNKILLREVNESQWVGVETGGAAGNVLVRLGTSPEGRLVATGLIVGPTDSGELTARSLRAIPLAQIITVLAGLIAQYQDDPEDIPGVVWEASPDEVSRGARRKSYRSFEALISDLVLARADRYEGPRARPGPKGHPPEHYERVAAAYREALIASPRAPMKALAKQLHASDATVRRWVQRARDKGLLGPSMPGKAGEEPQP